MVSDLFSRQILHKPSSSSSSAFSSSVSSMGSTGASALSAAFDALGKGNREQEMAGSELLLRRAMGSAAGMGGGDLTGTGAGTGTTTAEAP